MFFVLLFFFYYFTGKGNIMTEANGRCPSVFLFFWDLECSITSKSPRKGSVRVMERPSLPPPSVFPWVHRNYCPKAYIAVIPERLGVTQWLIKTISPLLQKRENETRFPCKFPTHCVNLFPYCLTGFNWVIKPPDKHGDPRRVKCPAASLCTISIAFSSRKAL